MKNIKIIIVAIAFLLIGVFVGKSFFTGEATEKIENHTQAEHSEEHWTCSMHPQIDMPESGQCPICGMDLIPKENDSDDDSNPNRFKMSKTATALANIQTLTIGNSASSFDNSKMTLSGKIMKNDNNTALQTAHFGGRIERLYYK
jgi:Cu(I)/Ag(I) efflux system membrane fusion protein